MEYVKLEEICTIVSGGTPSRSKPNYWNNGNIPWIKIKDMKSKYIDSAEEFITEEGLNNSSTKMLKRDTILYSIFATLGEVGILKIDACTNQAIAGLSLKEDSNILKEDSNILKEYLYYYLKSKKKDVNNLGRGVAQNNINLSLLRKFKIPVIPLRQQKKIIEVLDNVSSTINNYERELALLDELVKARFVEMFGEIEDCDKWESKIWNEVVTIKNGRDYKKVLVSDGGYPVVGTGGEIARASKYLCPENTIVVGRKGSINNPMLMKEKFWNVDTAFGVIPNSDYLHYQYFYYFCKFYNFMKLNKATTLPSTTKADLLKIRINIPPLELQNQFASFVQEIDKSRSRIQKSLEASQELFDCLMQEYFG